MAPGKASQLTVRWSGRAAALVCGALAVTGCGGGSGGARPRSVIVASPVASGLYRMNPDGSDLRRLSPAGDSYDNAPSLSPSGREVVFLGERRDGSGLYRMALAGGPATLLLKTRYAWSPAWSPDGRSVAFSDFGLASGIGILDLRTRKVRWLTAQDDDHPTWSPDGRRIAFARDASMIWTIGVDGRTLRRLTRQVPRRDGGVTRDIRPSWSPDGKLIAFERDSDIAVVDVATGRVRRLVRGISPTWSPDGRELLFFSFHRGRPGLFAVGRTGRSRRLVQRGAWTESTWRYVR